MEPLEYWKQWLGRLLVCTLIETSDPLIEHETLSFLDHWQPPADLLTLTFEGQVVIDEQV